MATTTSYQTAMIDRLAITDPQLNTALGTPVRNIIEAVAEQLAGYDTDVTATSTLYSLSSVSGTELDYLVGQFGFTRQSARAARGTIRVSRDNTDAALEIPYGSQFYKPATSTTTAVYFQTTSYQKLAIGVTAASISVIATVTGAQGNVAASTVTSSTGFSSYVSVTNKTAMSGGRDAESDADLRTRFLDTVFRNESSTSDQYLALALADAYVSRAVLVGQASRYSEIVQASVSGTTGTASVSATKFGADVASVLDTQTRYWVTKTDSSTQLARGEYQVSSDGKTVTFVTTETAESVGPVVLGTTYNLSHAPIASLVVTKSDGTVLKAGSTAYTCDLTAGTITIPSTSTLSAGQTLTATYYYLPETDGEFFTLEFDYLSKHNRGGVKTVDLYEDGSNSTLETDVHYLDCSKLITSTNQSTWQHDDGTLPTVGDVYIPLSYQPMIGDTGSINVGVSTILSRSGYNTADVAAYKLLYDVSSVAGSSRAADAIELLGTVATTNGVTSWTCANDSSIILNDKCPMSIPYYYDSAVSEIQTLVDAQSVVTSDALVHETPQRHVCIYLTLMYSTFPRATVTNNVKTAVLAWGDVLGIGNAVQVSDILTVAANISGVDNVRLATQTDAAGAVGPDGKTGAYGIVEYQRDGTTMKQRIDDDFILAQNEILDIIEVGCYARSQRNWG